MALFYCIDIILIYTVTCANQGSIDASVLQQPDMSVLISEVIESQRRNGIYTLSVLASLG